MSCCPSCPDDFKVKNIPDEVECLVAKEAKLLSLKTDSDYSLLSSVPESVTDLSNVVVASTISGIANLNGLQITNQ